MKKLILVLLLLIVAAPAFAGSATLSWDPSPTPDVQYMAYYGNSPENLQFSQDAGDALTTEIKDLQPGDWYFTVRAYNDQGESADSDMVDKTIAAYTPESVPHDPIVIPAAVGTVTIQITVE